MWMLGKVLALVLLVGGGWLCVQGATSPLLRLNQTVIRGTDLVPNDQILPLLPTAGKNVFTVRTARLERVIELIPSIERAEVALVLPSTIRVTVHERTPRAVWEAGGRQALVDSNGLVLADTAELKPDSPLRHPRAPLPAIRAPEGPFVGPGDRVDPSVVLMAEAVAPQLDEIGLANGQVEYHPSTGLTLQAPGSHQILLGFSGDLQAKLVAYRAIRAHLERTRTTAHLVDVRFLERPYYR
jgi:hypothetical protein